MSDYTNLRVPRKLVMSLLGERYFRSKGGNFYCRGCCSPYGTGHTGNCPEFVLANEARNSLRSAIDEAYAAGEVE